MLVNYHPSARVCEMLSVQVRICQSSEILFSTINCSVRKSLVGRNMWICLRLMFLKSLCGLRAYFDTRKTSLTLYKLHTDTDLGGKLYLNKTLNVVLQNILKSLFFSYFALELRDTQCFLIYCNTSVNPSTCMETSCINYVSPLIYSIFLVDLLWNCTAHSIYARTLRMLLAPLFKKQVLKHTVKNSPLWHHKGHWYISEEERF